jgi:hypothetical protein
MPRFEGDEHQNIYHEEDSPAYTDAYKRKSVKLVHLNNTHQCSTAINGCKKNEGCQCKREYSRTDTIPETFVDNVTNRVVYPDLLICDLKIVPYNLAMMIDWDSHNVEYSGSAYCALYLYKYCYKDASKREIAFESEKEPNSLDEIKLFMYGRIMSSMSAVWHLFGYQDYPASEPPVCAFKVCTGAQLMDFVNRCEVTDLQIYYSQLASLKDLKYTEFLAKYNTSKTLLQFYSNNPVPENNVLLD